MVHSRPRVSIVLPVRNAVRTLDSALRSVERQTEGDFECLIVDDGSTDASTSIAQRFANADRRFTLMAEPHEGLVASLQKGVDRARGEFVARMDADDWMHRDRLSAQIKHLDAHPHLFATGCQVRTFPRASLTAGRRRYEDWLNQLDDPARLWRERFVECPVSHPTLFLRRSALRDHPYQDRGWPEDYDLLLRLLENGPVVGIVPRRLLGWRDHPARLSRQSEMYHLDRFTECRGFYLSQQFLGARETYILWGHGRTGRALRKALARHRHRPSHIVEVHPRRIGQTIHSAPVIPPEALLPLRDQPIIVSVAGTGPRDEIRTSLTGMQFHEGRDFVFAA